MTQLLVDAVRLVVYIVPMRPSADNLIRWYKDLNMLYKRIPSVKLLLFGEYLRELSVEDFQRVMDEIRDSHVRKLRQKAVGGMYGN